MFGIGFGEIIVILLVIFLVAPREIPKVIKKIALFFHELDKIKENIINLNDEVNDIIKDEIDDVKKESKPDDSEENNKNQEKQ